MNRKKDCKQWFVSFQFVQGIFLQIGKLQKKNKIKQRSSTCIESRGRRGSWIKDFPCGKFQTHQTASDLTAYETTVIERK